MIYTGCHKNGHLTCAEHTEVLLQAFYVLTAGVVNDKHLQNCPIA